MENEQTANIFYTHRKILILFSVLLFTTIVAVLISTKKTPPVTKKTTPIPTKPTPSNLRGSLYLKSMEDKAIHLLGDPVILYLFGSSNDQPITGFDAVLQSDKAVLSFKKATSQNQSFDVFASSQDNIISITGVKKIADQSKIILAETPLVKLEFTPKSVGKAVFSLDFTAASTKDSNLISGKKDILGKVSGTTIYVGEEITLQTGKSVDIGDLKIALIDAAASPVDCRDCIDSAKLTVEKGLAKEELEFKIGGFAGLKETQKEALGHIFEIDTIETGRIKIRVSSL